MPEKKSPIGICDVCGEEFPAHVSHYTSKGKPRLCCSKACTNALNSRAGAPIRSRKQHARIERGEWINPSPFVREDATEEEKEAYRRKMGAGVSRARKRQVAEGTWRNPALGQAARKKLSRPRVHGDNPTLHAAISKLRNGGTVADLTPAELAAHHAYRKRLDDARREQINAQHRRYYHERMSEPGERAKARNRWAREREALRKRPPNLRLRAAREQAGLTQKQLAVLVGVTEGCVSRWERHSVQPREKTKEKVMELLGKVF